MIIGNSAMIANMVVAARPSRLVRNGSSSGGLLVFHQSLQDARQRRRRARSRRRRQVARSPLAVVAFQMTFTTTAAAVRGSSRRCRAVTSRNRHPSRRRATAAAHRHQQQAGSRNTPVVDMRPSSSTEAIVAKQCDRCELADASVVFLRQHVKHQPARSKAESHGRNRSSGSNNSITAA